MGGGTVGRLEQHTNTPSVAHGRKKNNGKKKLGQFLELNSVKMSQSP